jgi:hypothetical protein
MPLFLFIFSSQIGNETSTLYNVQYIKLQRFLNLRYWSTGGETWYPVDYENIFFRIFFVYLRAESHNKVATNIFYFARAVSHAAVRTDRLCSNLVGAPTCLS